MYRKQNGNLAMQIIIIPDKAFVEVEIVGFDEHHIAEYRRDATGKMVKWYDSRDLKTTWSVAEIVEEYDLEPSAFVGWCMV